jgi:hypothetical protein
MGASFEYPDLVRDPNNRERRSPDATRLDPRECRTNDDEDSAEQ